MPNWCSNYLAVTGSADAIRQINEGFQKKNSFESIIGKDPTFEEKDWYNHNYSRYGTRSDVGPINTTYTEGDTALYLNIETALFPCTAFVKNMCEKYKVDAVLEYNECGNDFAGRVTVEWDGEELFMHVEEWDYHEGVYAMDSDQWMTNELESKIDIAKEEGLSAEDFVKSLPFLSEEDKQIVFNAYQKSQQG